MAKKICPKCNNAECCHYIVMKWKSLPSKELDQKISEFLTSTNAAFVEAKKIIMIKTHGLDNEFLTKLSQAFTRLAPNYVDQITERTIRKWEKMKEEDVELELIALKTEKDSEEFNRIWAFLYPEDLKLRLEKVLLHNVIPKVRHINLLKMIKRWESLSDEDLSSEVKTELFGTGWNSTTSHFTFVSDLYPNIDNDVLRKRVDKVLLSIMDPRKPVDYDMALYACSHLSIPGTVEAYKELVRQVNQESKKS
jgi:hypothetical protein